MENEIVPVLEKEEGKSFVTRKRGKTCRKSDKLSTTLGPSLRITLVIALCLVHSSFTYAYSSDTLFDMAPVLVSWFQMQDSSTADHASFVELYKRTFFNKIRMLHATLSLGASLGSLYTMKSSIRFGRKGSLLMTCFVTIFGSLFCGYAKYFSKPMFVYIGMFLFGCSNGVTSVITPIYISEIVPQRQKTLFNACISLFYTFGAVLGKLVTTWIGTETHWPLVMSLTVVPSFVVLFLLPLCPESPKYLYVIKGKELECKRALKWLRGKHYSNDEFQSIRKEFCQYKLIEGGVHLKTILDNKILKHAFIISILLMASKNTSGINTVVFYFQNVFPIHPYYYLIVYFVCNVFNLITIGLFPKKILLVTTFAGMGLMSLAACVFLGYNQGRKNMNLEESDTINMLIIILLTGHIVAFKCGIGSFGWFMPIELFTTVTIHFGFAISMSVGWFVLASFTVFYAPLQIHLGFLRMMNVVLFNLAMAYVSYTIVPEILNKTIKDIYFSIYLYTQKKQKIVL